MEYVIVHVLSTFKQGALTILVSSIKW